MKCECGHDVGKHNMCSICGCKQFKIKVTKKIAAEMVRLRKKGWTLQRIADRFGCTNETVNYHVNGVSKSRIKRQAIQWHKTHKKQAAERQIIWRRNNPEKVRKSFTLSILRGSLRTGIVTRKEINAAMDEV